MTSIRALPISNKLFVGTLMALCTISLMCAYRFVLNETYKEKLMALTRVQTNSWDKSSHNSDVLPSQVADNTTTTTRVKTIKTFMDYEVAWNLCVSKMTWRNTTRSHQCPKNEIVTAATAGGRLGNKMWEYATVWAVARITGLEPYVVNCVHKDLAEAFESLTLPLLDEIAHCPFHNYSFVTSLDKWKNTNQSIHLPRNTMKPKIVLPLLKEISQEFKFRKKLRDESQKVLSSFVKNSTLNHTFVGVHVRKTDYAHHLEVLFHALPANETFYLSAMEYYEHRYKNPVFIVVSDDSAWCRGAFSHKSNVLVVASEKNTPAQDMAIMAACNHSIVDYGTFGHWGAMLAGGETVYYNVTYHPTMNYSETLKDWHAYVFA